MSQDAVGIGASAVLGLHTGWSIGARAEQLGHATEIERTGSRFVIVCSCGWRTHPGWTRRHSFAAVMDHVVQVVNDTPESDSADNVSPSR